MTNAAKFAISLALYALAILCAYTALEIAPDMKWPQTETEMQAASLLVLCLIAKTIGGFTLVSIR